MFPAEVRDQFFLRFRRHSHSARQLGEFGQDLACPAGGLPRLLGRESKCFVGLACDLSYFTGSFLGISHPLAVYPITFVPLSEILAPVPKVLRDPTPFLGLAAEQLRFLATPLRRIRPTVTVHHSDSVFRGYQIVTGQSFGRKSGDPGVSGSTMLVRPIGDHGAPRQRPWRSKRVTDDRRSPTCKGAEVDSRSG